MEPLPRHILGPLFNEDKAGFADSYGAAGSLVILLVWVYYSAQVFFLGAEFTHVYATHHGSRAIGGNQDQLAA